MTCREVVEFLMAYTDGELPEAQRHAFDAHLKSCTGCEAYLRMYCRAIELCRKAHTDPCAQGPGVTDRIGPPPEELICAILRARSASAPPRP